MTHFLIHRMKEQQREHFRWAPHISAQSVVKAKDYEAAGAVEALHEYGAWANLRAAGKPLQPGDLLEMENGELRICKYVGFEPASWFAPEAPAANPAVSEATQ